MAGKKPVVPDAPDIDAGAVQKQTVKDNLAVLPDIQNIAAKQNTFNQGELDRLMEMAMPGTRSIRETATNLVGSQLRGEIPTDVQNQVQNNAAARAISGGFGGSGMHGNLVARDLGLTSMDIQKQGMNSAAAWMQMAKSSTAPLFDGTSMFLTPQQRTQYAFANRDFRMNRDWMAAQVAAMPDPTRAAIGQAIVKTDDQMMAIAASAAGSMTKMGA